MEVLAQRWLEIRAELDDATFARLRDLVATFATQPAGLRADPHDLVALLGTALPRDHPVRAALRETNDRFASTVQDPDTLVAWVNLVASLRGMAVPADPLPTVDDVARGAAAWLLAAPALDAASVLARGVDPGDPDLIVLDSPDGARQWPAFQFDDHGR